MPSNIQSFGVDLDSIFSSRISTKGPNVNYSSSGIDISNLYEPISSANYTLSATPPNTSFIGQRILNNTSLLASGSDLLTKFCGTSSLYSTSSPSLSPSIVARTTPWTGTVTFKFTATWPNSSAFVQFWNVGGRILVNATRVGGTANSGNAAITNMLSDFGQAVTADTATFLTGGGVNNTAVGLRYGGINVPASSSNVAQVTGQSNPYASDACSLLMRTITSQIQLEFSLVVSQGDSGSINTPINGTLTPIVQARVYAGQPLPTFSVTQNF